MEGLSGGDELDVPVIGEMSWLSLLFYKSRRRERSKHFLDALLAGRGKGGLGGRSSTFMITSDHCFVELLWAIP